MIARKRVCVCVCVVDEDLCSPLKITGKAERCVTAKVTAAEALDRLRSG